MTEKNTLVHKAGFISILGKPNAGKSTLLNAILGQKLSIVTPKAQTTRHRILGILNHENYQMVFSDTPGIIKPAYELQKQMMKFVGHALEDADVLLIELDATDEDLPIEDFLQKIEKHSAPKILVINKIDIANPSQIEQKKAWGINSQWFRHIIQISALHGTNVPLLIQTMVDLLPIHPPYFDKEELSDRNVRFFCSEILREKIFLHYKQEIPYSTEVVITGYKEKADIHVISAEVMVERDTQKGILLGKNGMTFKKVCTQARMAMEDFIGAKVYLETHIKVVKDWRTNSAYLKRFGYE